MCSIYPYYMYFSKLHNWNPNRNADWSAQQICFCGLLFTIPISGFILYALISRTRKNTWQTNYNIKIVLSAYKLKGNGNYLFCLYTHEELSLTKERSSTSGNLLTYLRSWALLEKLPLVQPLKNFPAFYGTRRFITAFTRALHWSLSWARSSQSISSHPISLRSILILFNNLRLGLPSGLFYINSSSPPFVLHALPISSSLTWSF
jgi:hypothetical protein